MSEKLLKYDPEIISEKIFTVRGQRIIFDFDLAEIYGVPTKRLNEQIKRNKNRFPADFMFKITSHEWEALKSQIAISNSSMRSQFATASKRNVRFFPYAFTEHGAAMAANVLNSPRAIEMSIFIVRAFIRLRQMLLGNKELRQELDEMKRQTNDRFQIVFETIRTLWFAFSKSAFRNPNSKIEEGVCGEEEYSSKGKLISGCCPRLTVSRRKAI